MGNDKSKTYYGILKYNSINIGDEIQSIAASRFLPHIDYYINRETIRKWQGTTSEEKTKLICNAWWMWCPSSFPPPPTIEPCLISMHICPEARKHFLKPEIKNYLLKHGPVGCRDKSTANFLNANKIPAYFSGCLTLTLERIPGLPKKDFIITVDLPEHIVRKIRERTNRPVYDLSRFLMPSLTINRLSMAKTMLYLYQSAHCVISSRLHVAMPCLALQTPVLLIDTNDETLHNDGRYDGLRELCNTISEDDFLASDDAYNLENPPRNKDDYKKIRDELIQRCFEFTGFDRKDSLFAEYKDSDTIILNLISCLRYDYNCISRFCWYTKGIDVVKCILKRVFLKKTQHDLP